MSIAPYEVFPDNNGLFRVRSKLSTFTHGKPFDTEAEAIAWAEQRYRDAVTITGVPHTLPDIRDQAMHLLKGAYPAPGQPQSESEFAARLVALYELVYNGLSVYYAKIEARSK